MSVHLDSKKKSIKFPRLHLDEEHAFVGIGHSNSDMEAADLDLKAERVASPSPFQYQDLPTSFQVSSLAAARWGGDAL